MARSCSPASRCSRSRRFSVSGSPATRSTFLHATAPNRSARDSRLHASVHRRACTAPGSLGRGAEPLKQGVASGGPDRTSLGSSPLGRAGRASVRDHELGVARGDNILAKSASACQVRHHLEFYQLGLTLGGCDPEDLLQAPSTPPDQHLPPFEHQTTRSLQEKRTFRLLLAAHLIPPLAPLHRVHPSPLARSRVTAQPTTPVSSVATCQGFPVQGGSAEGHGEAHPFTTEPGAHHPKLSSIGSTRLATRVSA